MTATTNDLMNVHKACAAIRLIEELVRLSFVDHLAKQTIGVLETTALKSAVGKFTDKLNKRVENEGEREQIATQHYHAMVVFECSILVGLALNDRPTEAEAFTDEFFALCEKYGVKIKK